MYYAINMQQQLQNKAVYFTTRKDIENDKRNIPLTSTKAWFGQCCCIYLTTQNQK